jgi:hypothetical protein
MKRFIRGNGTITASLTAEESVNCVGLIDSISYSMNDIDFNISADLRLYWNLPAKDHNEEARRDQACKIMQHKINMFLSDKDNIKKFMSLVFDGSR